jgi:hypothetical protein
MSCGSAAWASCGSAAWMSCGSAAWASRTGSGRPSLLTRSSACCDRPWSRWCVFAA